MHIPWSEKKGINRSTPLWRQGERKIIKVEIYNFSGKNRLKNLSTISMDELLLQTNKQKNPKSTLSLPTRKVK